MSMRQGDWDDEELEELENRAMGKANAEEAVSNARELAEEISNLDIDEHVLRTIRDAFLVGKDLEAVAILANELGYTPNDDTRWKEVTADMKAGGQMVWQVGSFVFAVVCNRPGRVRFRVPIETTVADAHRPAPPQNVSQPPPRRRHDQWTCHLCSRANTGTGSRCFACNGVRRR